MRPPIDAKIKLKYKRVQSGQYASPFDPYDVEISFNNMFLDTGRFARMEELHIGGEWIKGIEIAIQYFFLDL